VASAGRQLRCPEPHGRPRVPQRPEGEPFPPWLGHVSCCWLLIPAAVGCLPVLTRAAGRAVAHHNAYRAGTHASAASEHAFESIACNLSFPHRCGWAGCGSCWRAGRTRSSCASATRHCSATSCPAAAALCCAIASCRRSTCSGGKYPAAELRAAHAVFVAAGCRLPLQQLDVQTRHLEPSWRRETPEILNALHMRRSRRLLPPSALRWLPLTWTYRNR